AADGGSAALSSEKREQLLKAELERCLPRGDEKAIGAGLDHAVKLGLLYLEERRLEDADTLFQRLATELPVKRYRFLGRLGRAIVCAHRDQTGESNRRFREVFVWRQLPPERKLAWLADPADGLDALTPRL